MKGSTVHQEDKKQALLLYVLGYFVVYNERMGLQRNKDYEADTLNKVYNYLYKTGVCIDGSYSDLQADICLRASKIFVAIEISERSRILRNRYVSKPAQV
jgi:uncharacterized membrane protein (UPF0182 family)